MRHDTHFQVQTQTSAVSWQVWTGSRVAAALIAIGFIWALFQSSPLELVDDLPVSQPAFTLPADIVRQRRPEPPVFLPSPPAQLKVLTASPKPDPRLAPLAQSIQERATPLGVRPQSTGVSPPAAATLTLTTPNIARAPTAQAGTPPAPDLNSSGVATSGRLSAGTLGILRARECARLDIRDRPANCPPNDELMRMLAQERGPHYRPENAEGFSRNEMKWRGVPPPCLEDGKSISVSGRGACIRFGDTPSRVRSVREICEAKGLGGCADAPSQAAVNAAVKQAARP